MNFFYFFNPFAGSKAPFKMTVVKFGIYKRVYFYFYFCPRTSPNLLIAFSWLFAFLQIVDTCFWKFNLLSVSIPISVTDSLDFISALFTVKQQLWFDLFCLSVYNNCLKLFRIYNHVLITEPFNSYFTFFSNNLHNSFKSLFAA